MEAVDGTKYDNIGDTKLCHYALPNSLSAASDSYFAPYQVDYAKERFLDKIL